MSINWDLENADSIVDARRSSAGIVRVRDPRKKTGNNRWTWSKNVNVIGLMVCSRCERWLCQDRDNCSLITRNETGLKTWLCIIPRDEKSTGQRRVATRGYVTKGSLLFQRNSLVSKWKTFPDHLSDDKVSAKFDVLQKEWNTSGTGGNIEGSFSPFTRHRCLDDSKGIEREEGEVGRIWTTRRRHFKVRAVLSWLEMPVSGPPRAIAIAAGNCATLWGSRCTIHFCPPSIRFLRFPFSARLPRKKKQSSPRAFVLLFKRTREDRTTGAAHTRPWTAHNSRLIDEKIPIRFLCSMEYYVVVIGRIFERIEDFFEPLERRISRNSLTYDSVVMQQQGRDVSGSLEN